MNFHPEVGVLTRARLKKMIGTADFLSLYWKTPDEAAIEVRAKHHLTNPQEWESLRNLCTELWREARGIRAQRRLRR
jgi:hypothetical protein